MSILDVRSCRRAVGDTEGDRSGEDGYGVRRMDVSGHTKLGAMEEPNALWPRT